MDGWTFRVQLDLEILERRGSWQSGVFGCVWMFGCLLHSVDGGLLRGHCGWCRFACCLLPVRCFPFSILSEFLVFPEISSVAISHTADPRFDALDSIAFVGRWRTSHLSAAPSQPSNGLRVAAKLAAVPPCHRERCAAKVSAPRTIKHLTPGTPTAPRACLLSHDSQPSTNDTTHHDFACQCKQTSK
jgi:hypothetical protein